MTTTDELRAKYHRVRVEHPGPRDFRAECTCGIPSASRGTRDRAAQDAIGHLLDMQALGARINPEVETA